MWQCKSEAGLPRRIQREQRGQTSAEYFGVLVVVGFIVAAILASGLVGRLTGGIEDALCLILGGECRQQEPEQEQTPPGGEGPPPPADSGRAEREVYDADCGGENDLPGELVRENGDDPTGDADVDSAYTDIGLTYDYFADTFGRDSYDDDGAEIIASINYCEAPGVPVANAFWSGEDEQIRFGEGWGDALDITAHELTHAINDKTAQLEYECQSGALSESMSDIFASNVDDDWEIGEDLPGGALRDMSDPESYGDPAHVDDLLVQENDGTSATDYGGVHTNSSIPNHAYYLMVEEIGRDPAEQVVYRAFTEKLESDSDFEGFRSTSLEAAEELYGEDSPEYSGVNESFAEVGLDGNWEAPEIAGC